MVQNMHPHLLPARGKCKLVLPFDSF
jgi:hypothetical protein